MRNAPGRNFLLALPMVVALAGCEGKIEGSQAGQSATSVQPGSTATGGSSGAASLPPNTQTAALLPTRIRRLTNSEFENSVKDVVQNPMPVATDFVPDSRQSGFTVNDAQRVDSVLIKQIAGAATTLAAQVRAQLDSKAPCASPTTQADACATSFIRSFATRAFRRPLGDDEVAKLLALYHAGADGATYADGIELVATGVLQSAGFLYLTETGSGASTGNVNLTPYEVASEMSYLLTGGPPTDVLLSAAAKGQLATPAQRIAAIDTPDAHNSTLLQTAGAEDRVVRVVREWLGTDELDNTAKDTTVYQAFAGLKPAMIAETSDFLVDLVALGQGKRTVQELLGADWTSTTDANLAKLYGAASPGNASQRRITLPTRRGILNQGAFLSVYAHASETAPVLRGVALLRRITCIGVPSPATLNITVVPLVPDTTKSMRTRLNAHVTDKVCAGCHNNIDNFGFAFEIYDGMGAAQSVDHGQPVNSTVTIATGTDVDGTYTDSNALALALSKSQMVRECFARNIFRASAGRSDDDVQMSEDDFVKFWKTQTGMATSGSSFAGDGDIIDTVRAYIASPTFNIRRAQ